MDMGAINPHSNPNEDIPAKIETRLTPWTPKYGKRIASISGYGATGTNVNAVLEEAPPIKLKFDRHFQARLKASLE